MRSPFMALCQALQFELMFRQIDIRGTWHRVNAQTIIQSNDVVVGEKFWRGITMDMLKLGAQLVVQTSKTGQPVVHAIDSCQLVVNCLRIIEAVDGPVARQAPAVQQHARFTTSHCRMTCHQSWSSAGSVP
jgi:hypothetical protein